MESVTDSMVLAFLSGRGEEEWYVSKASPSSLSGTRTSEFWITSFSNLWEKGKVTYTGRDIYSNFRCDLLVSHVSYVVVSVLVAVQFEG